MHRLVGTSQLRNLQSKLSGVAVRSNLSALMDSKQEDIVQPIGRQSPPKQDVREFTSTTVEGELGKSVICLNWELFIMIRLIACRTAR